MIMEGSAGVGLSVVPLLQERFRQLQKMKELREEKELLRLLYSTTPTITGRSHNNNNNNYEVMMFVQQQPPNPHCQLSLSLWPGAGADCRGSLCREREREGPSNISKSWWFADQNSASDIDTTLHL